MDNTVVPCFLTQCIFTMQTALAIVIAVCISRESKTTRNVYWSRASVCACVSVCLSVRRHMPTLLHGPRCNLGE